MQEYEDAPPPADALTESLRGFGYSAETAIADIIDNSITARARSVFVNVSLAAETPYISILDDGDGMSEETLREAMKLGSQNPLIPRDKMDLGRFGLGLKTASFSQARSLTVATKQKGGKVAVRRWDLDYLASSNGHWRLLTSAPEHAGQHLQRLEELESGTLVLWNKLDRVRSRHSTTEGAAKSHLIMEQLEHHLAMVFHRYLEGVQPRLKIHVNEAKIRPWDPFMSSHPACRPSPEDTVGSGDARIRLKGYVLPNKDMVADESAWNTAGGSEGWVTSQGFYIYRNDRLLVAGGWLGLGRPRPWVRDETHKLARIRVDLAPGIRPSLASRNIVAFHKAAQPSRLCIVRAMGEIGQILRDRQAFDLDVAAAEACARLLFEAEKAAPRAALAAAGQLLPMLLRQRKDPVSLLIAAAFPLVYRELAKKDDVPDLLKFVPFFDWDRCKAARQELVAAFMSSSWSPGDLALTACRCNDLGKILRRTAKAYGGDRYIERVVADLSRLPDDCRRAAAQTISAIRSDRSSKFDWRD